MGPCKGNHSTETSVNLNQIGKEGSNTAELEDVLYKLKYRSTFLSGQLYSAFLGQKG